MRSLFIFVLATVTVSAGADLKVKLTIRGIGGNDANSAAQQPVIQACSGRQCVTVPDQPGIHEQTMYVHGSSQRIEFTGMVMGQGPGPFSDEVDPAYAQGQYRATLPHMAVITHCDTGQVIELDLDSHEYREFKQPKYPTEKEFQKELERVRKDAEKRVQWQTQDTGETREIYGHLAKHQITTIREKMFKTTYEERVDGWYIDLPEPGCAPEYLRRGQTVMLTFDGTSTIGTLDIMTSCNCLAEGGDWSDHWAYSSAFWAEGHFVPVGFRAVSLVDAYNTAGRYTTALYVGFTPSGLAVAQQITDNSTPPAAMREVLKKGVGFITWGPAITPLRAAITAMSDAPVAPALFDVPAGFVKVKHLYRHSNLLQKSSPN